MLVNKVTTGFVIQVFDTETGRFVSQEFVAGDQCDYEDGNGVPVCSEALEVGGKEASLPFDMVQPQPSRQSSPVTQSAKHSMSAPNGRHRDPAGHAPSSAHERVHRPPG